MARTMSRLVLVCTGAGLAGGLYRLVVSGAVTLDTRIGRRTQPLGPLEVHIASTPEIVFDVVAGPYLGRTPRAMHDKLEVLERGADMVLAAHYTDAGRGVRTTTVETVRFERPHTVCFRLVRGPVPHVEETFAIAPSGSGTTLRYQGTLGTDFWGLGSRWGALVGRKWVATVDTSLRGIAADAERRAARRPHPA